MLMQLDHDPDVLQYSSEEVIIPYRNPVTQTIRRYFMDFWVKRKMADGSIREQLIEIKPAAQTKRPVASKNGKTNVKQQLTFATNTAKWEAATKYCEKRGWDFMILTEHHLGIAPKR